MLSKAKSKYEIGSYYILIPAVLCLLYALIFQPISWQARGDSGAYITLAKQFLGVDTTGTDLSNRAPFYSTVLAIFIKIFGERNFLQWVVYFQYALIFVCGFLIFKLFEQFIENKNISALIVLIFLFNLSTIAYGYMILTETLTLFLFICITFITTKYLSTRNKKGFLFLLGFLTGLLILTRYNMLLIPLCIIFCIFVAHFIEFRWKNIGTLSIRIFIFLIPLVFILNIWCYRNYREYNFYFLFPPSYGYQNTRACLVNENTKVSPKFQQVLEIFLWAKKEVLSTDMTLKKDSILKFIPIKELLIEINSGYRIYKKAQPELLKLFQSEQAVNPEFLLGEKLRGFYKEVAAQNKFKLFLLRIYSLVNGFRASTSTLPTRESLNLNILPSIIFVFYKIIFFILSLSFFIITVFYMISILKKKQIKGNYIQITLIALILYFPFINFLVSTLSNANRFKYPSEPLMLGMLVYYIYYFFNVRKKHV